MFLSFWCCNDNLVAHLSRLCDVASIVAVRCHFPPAGMVNLTPGLMYAPRYERWNVNCDFHTMRPSLADCELLPALGRQLQISQLIVVCDIRVVLDP